MCVHLSVRPSQSTCQAMPVEVREQLVEDSFLPSSTWAMETQLRSPGLAAAPLPAQPLHLINPETQILRGCSHTMYMEFKGHEGVHFNIITTNWIKKSKSVSQFNMLYFKTLFLL